TEVQRNVSAAARRNLCIFRFESWHPSQPVEPVLAGSGLLENIRLLRGLVWCQPVSAIEHLAFVDSTYIFWRASLWSRYFYIQVLLLETLFENTEHTCLSLARAKAQRTDFVLSAWIHARFGAERDKCGSGMGAPLMLYRPKPSPAIRLRRSGARGARRGSRKI